MANVLIAFSGGVESTALLEKALVEGHNVVLCMINVHGHNVKRLAEIAACERIIANYKEYAKLYKGSIVSIAHMPVCPWIPTTIESHALAHNGVTQQFATVLGMMSIRRYFMHCGMPTTWIGWIKEDSSDYSFNEMDFSSEQYKQLLDLPKLIGPLSNSDLSGCGFRAPFWDMSKSDILDIIPDQIKPLLIPNGSSYVTEGNVVLNPYKNKIEEWVKVGLIKLGEDLMPIVPKYEYSIKDASFEARYVSGLLLPKDLDLIDTLTNQRLLEHISPFLAKGCSVILDTDFLKIKSEMRNMLRVITDID